MSQPLYILGAQLSPIRAAKGSGHPNRMRFRGVLVQLDSPSNKPPNGSQGHRIMVPTNVARKRLDTLIGMGLNYSPDLDAHAQRRKVGVIDKAWIKGNQLLVEGHVWKHDFPEAERDLKQKGLGMSMELGEVRVDNPHADVWRLDDFQFLGATVLWRNSAAYNNTHAIAARAEQRREGMKVQSGDKQKKVVTDARSTRVAQIAAEAAAGAVRKGTAKVLAVLDENTRTLTEISANYEELETRLAALEGTRSIAAKKSDDDGDDDSCDDGSSEDDDYDAAKAAPASSSSEGDGAGASSTTSEEDMNSEVDKGDLDEKECSLGEKAGHLNEDAEGGTGRGHDGAAGEITKVGSTVASARERALRSTIRDLQRKLEAAHEKNSHMEKKFGSKLERLQQQVTAATDRLGRKSVSAEVTAMLAKGNINPADLYRTNTKMSVAEVDGLISSSGVSMNSVDRIALKQSFLRSGLMDEGRVERTTR